MSENKKYYWLKLKENFFEEKQIKYLRKLPEGDKITICYLKMQLKSLRTEGFIKYDRILPSNVEELAMILDEEPNIINLMIQALLKVTAIEILDDGSFYMLAMQDLIGKEGESAERVRKFREKQKKLPLQCNADVTKCNTEIEIEKEIEIEQEQEREISDVAEFYNNNIGLLTPYIYSILEDYIKELGTEIVLYALKKSAEANAKSLNYIKAILDNWVNNGYKTLLEIKNEEEKRKGKRDITETDEERKARIIKELEEKFKDDN